MIISSPSLSYIDHDTQWSDDAYAASTPAALGFNNTVIPTETTPWLLLGFKDNLPKPGTSSFLNSFLLTGPFVRQQLTIDKIYQGIGTPIPISYFNEFDDFGYLVSLKRLKEEKNVDFKNRILQSMVKLANSTYRGLINGITRELGLELYCPLIINPRKDVFGNFLAEDPYIKFDGVWLLLYSDYKNDVLDWAIDRFQPGGNYETIGRLINQINETSFFEASLSQNVDPDTKSMTIFNQSNREQVRFEKIPQSTRFKLQNKNLIPGTVLFTNRVNFLKEVASLSQINISGDFFIDYKNGIISCFSAATTADSVRYQFIQDPFCPLASPIILHDINNENFKIKMFEQVLTDNGDFIHGLASELGVDIVNELLSVYPTYWGI